VFAHVVQEQVEHYAAVFAAGKRHADFIKLLERELDTL